MKRRQFIAAAGSAAAFWPRAAHAQQAKPMPRIGFMLSGPEADPQSQAQLAAFRSGLGALGWKEGQTIQIDYRWPGADVGRARASAAELAGLAPAVIMSGGTVASTALHQATTTIPIVFVNVTDPVAGGFVESLARPGGNMTGFTPFEYEISGKWLQLLKEIAPGIKRVALLGDPNNHNFKGFQKSFESVARSMAVEPIFAAIRDADDVERTIRSLAATPNGGLIITAAAFSITHRALIVALANKHKLPAIYWTRVQVVGGGLMSYGPDIPDLARQAASYVDRILKGAKPSELPVQAPIALQLLINANTAKAIDLAIPPALLARADEVIE